MKRNILLLATMLMMYVSGFSQNVIPNGGFEDWTLANPIVPHGWAVNPIIQSVTRTTDSHSGQYAVDISPINISFPGVLVLGEVSGIPFTARPIHLSMWMKYNTAQLIDTIFIESILTKWNSVTLMADTIATATAKLTGNVTTYTAMVFPYNYLSADMPDSIQISFLAGNILSLPGMNDTNTYVIVDDVSLGGRFASGMVFNDIDSNGVQGVNENGIGEQVIKFEPGPFYTTTNNNGYYLFSIDSGVTYTVSYVPHQFWEAYNNNLSYTIMATTADTNIVGLNFAIHPTNINVDVRISVSASRFRCSSESIIWVDYRNYGTTTENGRVELVIDTAQTFVSSVPPPDSVSGNYLYWFYNNFTPYSYGHIEVVVTNPGAIAIGDTLSVSANILPDGSEYISSEHRGEVRCSWDPNDKNVQPRVGEENYVLHGKQLEYLIRFQNTGNDTAYHVTIADTIDDVNLDLATLKIMGYSHPMTFSIEGQNVVIFRFNNIMLPDSNVNELASHGYVKYTIKPKAGLADNTVVENTAYIYFDSNPAVITNTIHSTYVSEIIVSVNEQKESDVKIYPNPTTGLLHITATESEIEKVLVHNITGKEVAVTNSAVIDLNAQPDGVYFITIVTDKGVATKKVMVAR